jgi:hypothetical protein
MNRFVKQFNPHRTLVVGLTGMPLDEFFATPPDTLLQ